MQNFENKYQNLLQGVPLVESPFFDQFATNIWSGETLRVATDLNRKGYAIIDLSTQEMILKFNKIKEELNSLYRWDEWRARELDSLRIQDAWKFSDSCKKIACDVRIISLLSSIYGRNAFPFQTLNFAVGTEQASHSDHVHFNSVPEKFMCGVWIPFEDVDDDNGPLFYYPSSHKWPSYSNEHIGVSGYQINKSYGNYPKFTTLWDEMAIAMGVSREIFKAKPGQALIWAANLIHGGSLMKDRQRTRWSQVTHYYFSDCAYTTPLANDIYQGQIYYRNIFNISNSCYVKNIINGYVVSEQQIENLLPHHMRNNILPTDFSEELYLQLNPDVKLAGSDAKEHYINFGRIEGRRYR